MKIEGTLNHVKTTLQQMKRLGLTIDTKIVVSDKTIPRIAYKIKEQYILINFN